MIIPHSIYSRISCGLALLMAMTLLVGCVATDPEYAGVLAAASTDCKGNEVVGVWTNSSRDAQPLGFEAASVLLFKPDGTGLRRDIPGRDATWHSRTTPFHWLYQGGGIWTAGNATIRFAKDPLATGNALSYEATIVGGNGLCHLVYIRRGDE